MPTPSIALALVSTILLAPAAGSAEAQEWTRFRGPNGCGVGQAPNLPLEWTLADCDWRVELPGVGYSSPVVWGDRLFLGASLQDDGTRVVLCLDRRDGSTIWKRSYPAETFDMGNATAYDASSPTVDEDRIYVMWATPEHYIVLAMDQGSGEELWRRDLGPFQGDHGFGASPILFEDLVIVANDQTGPSFVTALNRETGETVWKTDRRTVKTAYSTPMIYRPDDGPPQLILSCTAHGLSSLDPRTGKLNWELGEFAGQRVVGSPAIASGLIFASAGSGGGGKWMFAFRPGNPADGTKAAIAYELTGALPYVPTPVANGDLLFLWHDRGVVTCIDAPTGEVHWQERVGGTYFGSPVRVGDRLWCISREGELVVISATKQFQVLARVDLEERSHSTPAVAGGVMYLRTASHLMAVGGQAASR